MNRLNTAVLLSLAWVAGASAQTPSVTFLGMDVTTLGNWKGVYGQDGYVLPDYSLNAPPYTGFNAVNVNQRLLDIWSCSANHTCDPREPNKQPFSYTSAERVESYYYNRTNDDFQINTSDGGVHRIALYFCDYEFYGRQVSVIAHNTNTNAVLDTRTLSNYSGGVYLVYNYTGNVDFEVVDNITPTTDTIPNGTISGFFWGGSGGPPSAAPNGPVVGFSPLGVTSGSTVSGTVPIQVSLDDVPGVTSVQLQLDGQNLGAPMHYFVTDILASPVQLPFNFSWDTTTATNCTHTITAIAADANGFQAVSSNLVLTVNNGPANCGGTPPAAAAPTFSVPPGAYSTTQQVGLSTTTPGASIRYTTDGVTTPSETVGTLYTGTPIMVSSSTTIKAIAFKSGIPDSSVSTGTYTINSGTGGGGTGGGPLALVQSNATASQTSGNSSQSVAFNANITPGNTLLVFAQYYDSAVAASAGDSCNDQFTQIAGSPVTVTTAAGNGTAHWFIARNVAGGPCNITVTYGSRTDYGGMAIFEVSGLGSNVALDQTGSGFGTGTLATASITSTHAPSFAIAQIWSNGGGGAALGGNWATQERTRFSTLFQSNMAGWQILPANGAASLSTGLGGGAWVAMVANFYNPGGATTTSQAATPTFSPAPGAYTGPVTISTTTSGATIRYTTDGSTPTETNGTVYSGPISLTATTTIKAIAYMSGFTDSPVASGTYTVGTTTTGTGALVQSNATASGSPSNSSQSVAFAAGVTGGDTIFAFAQYYGPAVTAMASDTCGNAYQEITGSPVVNSGWGAAHWFIARNVAGGVCTVKVTYSSPTEYGGVAIFEVSGLGATVALDQFGSSTGSGTTASASITPTTASSFAIAQVWSDGGGGFALGGNWTTQERPRFSTLYQSNMAGWQVLSSAGAVSFSTPVGGGPWIAMIANFH